MMKNITLILFFVGALFQVGALSTASESKPALQSQKLSKSETKDKQDNTETKADLAKIDNKQENEKKAGKIANQEDKRQVASEPAYSCTEYWTDEFSNGYIQLGIKCSAEDSLCVAFFHIARNHCEKGNLIRYYCDPKQPSLFSTEKIKCEKSCESSGLSDVCVK